MSKYVKDLVTKDVARRLEGVDDALLVNVIGLDANRTVVLRRELREKDIHLLVIKNSKDVYLRLHRGPFPDLLAKVTDGLGKTTQVAYTPATDQGVHYRDPQVQWSWPSRKAVLPQYLVKEVKTSDGLGGLRAYSYTYGDLKVDLRGRGNLGFAWMSVVDHAARTRQTTHFNQDYC